MHGRVSSPGGQASGVRTLFLHFSLQISLQISLQKGPGDSDRQGNAIYGQFGRKEPVPDGVCRIFSIPTRVFGPCRKGFRRIRRLHRSRSGFQSGRLLQLFCRTAEATVGLASPICSRRISTCSPRTGGRARLRLGSERRGAGADGRTTLWRRRSAGSQHRRPP